MTWFFGWNLEGTRSSSYNPEGFRLCFSTAKVCHPHTNQEEVPPLDGRSKTEKDDDEEEAPHPEEQQYLPEEHPWPGDYCSHYVTSTMAFLSFFILIMLLPSLSIAFPTLTTGDSLLEKPTMDTTTSLEPRIAHLSDVWWRLRSPYTWIPSPQSHPFPLLSFLNTGDCLQEVSTYGGYRY